MALGINYLPKGDKTVMRTNRRLYINNDGDKIVTGDTPEECAFLFKSYGGEVTPAELEKWKGQIEKFIDGMEPKKKPAKKSEPKEDKKKTPKENKMETPEEDKG